MINLQRILCPVDLSEGSILALRFANAIASRYKASLRIIHVLENPHADIPGAKTGAFTFGEAMGLYKEERQEEIFESLRKKGSPVSDIEIIFKEGIPYEEVAKTASDLKSDMIIMATCTSGSHGLLAGCTTERVVRFAPCPVLSVRTDVGSKHREKISELEDLMDMHPDASRKILLPTDFSEHSAIASNYAFSLAIEYKAVVIILHVIESVAEISLMTGVDMPGYNAASTYCNDLANIARRQVRDICDKASKLGITTEDRVIYGNPRHEISNIAKTEPIDMIIIGTHGRRGFSRFIHGSVAEAVIRHASCSVLSVKNLEHDFLAS